MLLMIPAEAGPELGFFGHSPTKRVPRAAGGVAFIADLQLDEVQAHASERLQERGDTEQERRVSGGSLP